MNFITLIDGYKLDHRRQYPERTQRVYSNWTPRGSRVEGQNEVVFFGLQYFLRKYLEEGFHEWLDKPRDQVVREYTERVNRYLGPNTIGTKHIEELHELGYVPLKFSALEEGTKVPLRIPMFTVENTDERFAWLVNYIETILSNVMWMPCTSATNALRMRRILDDACSRTGGDPAFVDWQGHDFSFRGMAGPEAAALSGAGHLLYFKGTDTIPAIELVEKYYPTLGLIGGSVPATEHSVMCAGGRDSERETFERLLDLYPRGIVSVVSDTWDLWHVLTVVLPSLKDRILARDGKLVIRPDSGDPVDILCGDAGAPQYSPQRKGAVEILWDQFGGTISKTGHKLLNPKVGLIYGDAITHERARAITDRLEASGFASTNVVFGVGSYTYQYVTRDTYGFAMKATWVKVDGEGRDIWKKPVTDKGEKNSAKGRLAVIHGNDGKLVLLNQASLRDEDELSLLDTVWEDGSMKIAWDFEDVRLAANKGV